MNGKKKPRQPRWVADNSLLVAAALVAPVEDEVRARVNGQRHLALVRFAEGNATRHDLTIFDFTAAVGLAVAETGVGIEVQELARKAERVITDARLRLDQNPLGTIQAPTAPDYEILQELVALVDLQMQSMSRGDYQACQRSAVGALQRAGLFNPPEKA